MDVIRGEARSGPRTGFGERVSPHAERVSHSDAARLLKPALGPLKDILGERGVPLPVPVPVRP